MVNLIQTPLNHHFPMVFHYFIDDFPIPRPPRRLLGEVPQAAEATLRAQPEDFQTAGPWTRAAKWVQL